MSDNALAANLQLTVNNIQRPELLPIEIDYRLIENRIVHFIDLYELNLQYRAHPGGVYFLMPYLAEKHAWTSEQKLWFAFLNGNTQNPLTSYVLMTYFPVLPIAERDLQDLDNFFNRNWATLAFDTDRRYQKKDFIASVTCYRDLVVKAGSQAELLTGSFTDLWTLVMKQFRSFGRLASFSYLEYVKIMGFGAEADTLFLRDLSGSKSHRNGLCKVLGRDDLDWHGDNVPKYPPKLMDSLEFEAWKLLGACKTRFAGRDFVDDINYFTLESAFCTYKSAFRPNRRYPGVYLDMLHDRIKAAEKAWPEMDFSDFWAARVEYLPPWLRLEEDPTDPGVKPSKQNHFINTGQVIKLDLMHPQRYYDDGSWRKK